jgi:hypothetical protein
VSWQNTGSDDDGVATKSGRGDGGVVVKQGSDDDCVARESGCNTHPVGKKPKEVSIG